MRIPVPLYWLLIYPDKWEKENYLHGVGEMSLQRVIMRAENWSKGDRICGGQQFQTTGAGQTKDPMFYSDKCNNHIFISYYGEILKGLLCVLCIRNSKCGDR